MLARHVSVLIVLSSACVLLGDDSGVVRRWAFDRAGDAEGWTLQHDGENLTVANGALQFDISGTDAFIVSPPMHVPLDGLAVRVRLRADQPGSTQIYWTTDDYPAFGEQCVLTRFTPARASDTDDGFTTERFDLGRAEDSTRKLVRFRIDPYNGNTEGHVTIDSIEVLRLPATFSVSMAPRSIHVDSGEPVDIAVRLRHTGGRQPEGNGSVSWPGGEIAALPVRADEPGRAAHTVSFDEPGVHETTAILFDASGRETHALTTSVIVGEGPRLPLEPVLRTKRYRIDAVPAHGRDGFGAARWQVRTGADTWSTAGWLMPLCRVVSETENGLRHYREPSLAPATQASRADRVELRGDLGAEGRCPITVVLEPQDRDGVETLQITATMTPPPGMKLTYFSGPMLRVVPEDEGSLLDRYALFGGLEFLTPGWESSSAEAVGEQYADRWSPHPFKVSLPVMAIEARGLTRALMWHPLRKWDGVHEMPMATFASPNFLDEQDNHLMALSVPNAPRWCDENDPTARRAYVTAGKPIELRYNLYAEADLPVALTAQRWYEAYGSPPPPPTPHDDEEYRDIIARNYGSTMYWEEENGWRHHWYHLEKSSRFVPFMAAELLGHAASTGETKWVEHSGIAGRTIIDTAGTLAARMTGDGQVQKSVSSMRPDGTWPFTTSEEARQLTLRISGGRFDSLGEEGSTSLGTCVQPALTLLRHALLTGDNEATRAGLKALEAMRRFRVPRGAQVWEVHQQIPDIRAAALAVEAYHLGYRITGDARWLDDAGYWAWTGVPFVYSWHVPIERRRGQFVSGRGRNDANRSSMPLSEPFENPDRQVTPYGTLPVLGTSCYVVNWFGVLVQWCGMEWAWKVIELDADRPDPLLRYIADGVVASGLQQMFDREPWTGLYPDWWNLEANIASGALISAMLPMRCLQAQGRLPDYSSPWTRVLHEDRQAWHVSGWGEPIELDPPVREGRWSARLRFPKGQPNELVIARTPVPGRVTVNRQPISRTRAVPDEPGWTYLPDHQAVIIRFEQNSELTNIRIHWQPKSP